MGSSFLGYFFRVFCSCFTSSSIHNHICIHMFFLPHSMKVFWYDFFHHPLFCGIKKNWDWGGGRDLVAWKDLGEGHIVREETPKDTMILLGSSLDKQWTLTLCALLLIEELFADGTTCSVAALEVSVLAERFDVCGVLKLNNFNSRGVLKSCRMKNSWSKLKRCCKGIQ